MSEVDVFNILREEIDALKKRVDELERLILSWNEEKLPLRISELGKADA